MFAAPTLQALRVFSFALVPQASDAALEPPPIDPAITRGEIEQHVRVLASDAFEGRETGQRGALAAADYLARVLAASGLEPAGDGGGYKQRIHLVYVEHRSDPTLALFAADGTRTQAVYGVDFTVQIRGMPDAAADRPLRVVRSAADIPAEADPGMALILAANGKEARAWLEERGFDDLRGFGLELKAGGAKRAGARPSGARSGVMPETQGHEPADAVTLRGEISERALAGEFVRVRLLFGADARPLDDSNLVARIVGVGTPGHPELAAEVVVISAHFDHEGLLALPSRPTPESADEPMDLVFNGADDDASGVAAVLEMAQAFAAGPKPARTLVFLLATGEEKGLLGTEYYLDHPVASLEKTVANLNLEMIGRPDEMIGGAGHLWLTGFELSNLGPALAARELPIAVDPRPEQNFFRRSDNYAFVRRGIVGQTLSSYNLHPDYHTVQDEADALDFAHLEACVRAAYDAARMLADASLTPAWLPGKEPALAR